jgi:hypothetical protein
MLASFQYAARAEEMMRRARESSSALEIEEYLKIATAYQMLAVEVRDIESMRATA